MAEDRNVAWREELRQTIKNKEEDSGKKSKKAAAAATSADNKDESLADGLF